LMASKKTVRVGLIGLGSMGKNHARVLANLEGTKLVGIVDSEFSGESYQGIPVLSDLFELLERGLDYCVIATPTRTHPEVAVAAARAGTPCLIEKPLALTVTEAKRMVTIFEALGVPAAIGHVERYNPAVKALKSKIQEGLIGDVLLVATRRLSPLPERISDVGVTLDLATHDIDLTRFILDSEYATICAEVQSKPGREHDDSVVVLARMTTGTTVNHVVNWVSPLKERIVSVTGEKGILVADTLFADLTLFANGVQGNSWAELAQFGGVQEGDVIKFALTKTEPLRAEHLDFQALLSGEQHSVCGLRDGLATLAVAQRVLEASH